MPRINPEILVWARETAGLDREAAAAKLHLKDTRDTTGATRLGLLESGERDPSRAMLVKMAKQYRRPLLTFYLSKPPRTVKRGTDFRLLPDTTTPRQEALIDAVVRDVRARHSMIRAAQDAGDEEPERVPFVGTAKMKDGVAALVSSISETIGVSLDTFRRQRTEEAAFKLLRDHAEEAGVYVLLIGNLGSHHTTIDAEVFRGFALADEYAPLIVVNDQDSKAACSFTLIHELAHIWLGQTGISGGTPNREMERFCNDVASEFLLPYAELSAVTWNTDDGLDALQARITAFARARNVSSSMIAYKLMRSGRITYPEWRQLHNRYRRLWLDAKAAQQARNKEDKDSGPGFYGLRQYYVGTSLMHFTARMLSHGVLSTTKAAQVLGVKPRQVEPLLSRLRKSA